MSKPRIPRRIWIIVWVGMILCLSLICFLSRFQVRNLSILIPGVSISSAMGTENFEFGSLATATETHTERAVSIWGDTAIGYMRALFQCQSSECDLEHVIIETNVGSRFNLPLSNPTFVRIEYGFDLRNERVFASTVSRDHGVLPPNLYEQFVNAQQLVTDFGEVINTARGISENSFVQSNTEYTLSITWADCTQVRNNTWCIDFSTNSERIKFEYDLGNRMLIPVLQ